MTKVFNLLVCLSLAYQLAPAIQAQPQPIYVNASATGANNGVSWTNAYTDLQSALTNPNLHQFDEIWVAAGTYKPVQPGATQDRTKSFHIPLRVKVFGGFAGTEGVNDRDLRNEFANETILDGDIGTASVSTDNSYHVVYFTDADQQYTKLSGFTIRNGYAYDSGNPTHATHNVGGGIFLEGPFLGAGPSLERLKISGNSAYIAGGGMYTDDNVPVYLANCRFEYNSVLQSGGEGGAASFKLKGAGVFQNCVFFQNESNGLGGGVSITSHYITTIFANCTFNANSATGVTQNGATRYGHAVYSTDDAGATQVYNTIAWGNGGTGQLQLDGPTSSLGNYFDVWYSDIQNGSWSSTQGNLSPPVDPAFRDASNGILTVSGCSPCVDTGLTVWNPSPSAFLQLLQYDNTDVDEDTDFGEDTPWDFKNYARVVDYYGGGCNLDM